MRTKVMALTLACILAAVGTAAAQEHSGFTQEGRATLDMPAAGLQAAHASLPLGSVPMVRNIATGQEARVTIVGRIPLSGERIIDLSADAASAIGIQPGGAVLVHFPAPDVHASTQGINIVIHNHVIPQSAWHAQGGQVGFQTHQSPMPRVTPGLPDPNSGRLYRLHVGTWTDIAISSANFTRLRDASFDTIHTFSREEFRVYVNSVRSQDVLQTVMRLGAMGFMEIHISPIH